MTEFWRTPFFRSFLLLSILLSLSDSPAESAGESVATDLPSSDLPSSDLPSSDLPSSLVVADSVVVGINGHYRVGHPTIDSVDPAV